MNFRNLLLALFCLAAPSAAFAGEWRVQAVEGGASVFAAGEWSAAQPGVRLPANAVVQTSADGRVRVARERDELDLAPATKIKIEGESAEDTTVRAFEGALGVAESAGSGKSFTVMTTHASATADGADFGVVADASGTTIAVTVGVVSVTDIAGRRTTEVREGQTLRIGLGGATAFVLKTAGDPASAAARDAALLAATGAPSAAKPEGEAAKVADPHALGAIKADRRGDGAKAVDEATDRLHELKGKAKLGKGDPKTVAAVARMEQELLQGIDVETDPLDDDFKWTQVEDGEVRLKPISTIVLGLSGNECFEFWLVAVLACAILGGLTSAVLKEAGFGIVLNGAIVMLAFIAAVLLRDTFFRTSGYIPIEPFLSLGMMIGAMPLLLLVGAFAKMRLDV